MRLGVTLSGTVHAVILSWGLLSVGAPEPLRVADVEALPIDIVPVEEITNAVQGAKDAEITPTPAPTPTRRQEPTPEAANVGDAQDDSKSVEADNEAPKAVEQQAQAQEPEPAPTPAPEPKVEELIDSAKATELAAITDPATPVLDEAPADQPEIAEEGEQFAKLPNVVPVPVVKPKLPKPNTAKTQNRKNQDTTKSADNSGGAQNAKEKVEDELDKLINREEASAGGAKSSTQVASLGTSTGRGAGRLSQSEMDALRSAISQCSTGLAGRQISDDLTIRVIMKLDRNGFLTNDPLAEARGGTSEERRRYSRDILRFIKRCEPYDFLPKDKYETWAEVVPTFYPAEMFR